MTITYLEPGREASCTTGEVTIRPLLGGGLTTHQLVVSLTRVDGVPFEGPTLVRADGTVVLPRVSGRIEVKVASREPGSLFGPGSRVRLLVHVVSADDGLDQVQSPEVDVAGLRDASVLWIEITRPGVLVVGSAAATVAPVAPPAEGRADPGTARERPTPPVTSHVNENPVTGQARAEARARAGGVRARPAELRSFAVILDLSASMSAHRDSGAVGALLSSLVGLNDVYGAGPDLPVLAGWASHSESLGDLSDDSVADLLDRAYAPPTTGFALTPALGNLGAGGHRTVFVLTDDEPPDLAELTHAQLTGADGQLHCHVVVLGCSPADVASFESQGAPVALTALADDPHRPLESEMRRPSGVRALLSSLLREIK